MLKLLVLAALFSITACTRQVHPKYVEAPDPEVGDMTCGVPMSIEYLLLTMGAPDLSCDHG